MHEATQALSWHLKKRLFFLKERNNAVLVVELRHLHRRLAVKILCGAAGPTASKGMNGLQCYSQVSAVPARTKPKMFTNINASKANKCNIGTPVGCPYMPMTAA